MIKRSSVRYETRSGETKKPFQFLSGSSGELHLCGETPGD